MSSRKNLVDQWEELARTGRRHEKIDQLLD